MIEIEDLTVIYRTREGKIRALENINVDIKSNEIFGIVGESGSGKTTLAMTIMGLLPRNGYVESGSIKVDGDDILKLKPEMARMVRGKVISLVFQGAMNSLNPLLKIEDQVAEPLLIHRSTNRGEALRRARETLELMGLDSFTWKKYPHELSGGMKQRAVIATAMIMKPSIIIADEPSTALDVITQAQLMNILKELQKMARITIIFISHDFPLVSEMADRIMILYGGKPSEIGSNRQILSEAGHPYTKGLINSVPMISARSKPEAIPGEPVNIKNPPAGCRFKPRCKMALDSCGSYDYSPKIIEGDHMIFCKMFEGGKDGRST
ncbi:MAG: ABC transporter ATP-binding protein [Thermoplasmatales archaeon]|jgi:peptide/nickel transport system ATP-binding protein|nr:ABC transporter ATP-binding protein [Candidatus Thermoplasmatota archaeon]MCL6002988.1 ABC transporter ATP-binding protein [Candidatus Thermoplasmatota archaeon]MDA8054490.1 ABC transporter ATP-binding protein [Thermoplasmatales archaeon]